MDHPAYADPIVIPITLTIPDLRWQPQSGRWDHGSFYPPIHSGRGQVRPEDRAPVTLSPATEPRLAILAQYAGAGLLSEAPPVAAFGPDLRQEKKLMSDAARAMRRIREIAEETSRGELGAVAGHLFLNSPYPAGLEDPLGPIVHIEPTDPSAKPSDAEIKLNGVREAAEQDLDRRRADELDERHLSDAEADRRGEPVIRGGRIYDHENEVAQGKQGLEHKLDDLEKKLLHETAFGKSDTSDDALDSARKTVKEIKDFIREIDRRLPGLQVRQGGGNDKR